jgi:hypothetical protein
MARGWTAIAISALVALESASVLGRSPGTSLQALLAAPDRYANRAVTVTGRFRGRTAGDGSAAALPPLNRSRWDFLLNEAGAAVWVSGIRPAGWDFDLDPRSPEDARTGRWLEVTGTVRVAGGSARSGRSTAVCPDVWIEASDLRAARPPSESGMAFAGPIRPAVQPPVVVFNDPIDEETNVPPATAVRLQFSRAMVPGTFSERIRIGYASAPGIAAPPIPKFSAIYADATRSLAIAFEAPLAPRRLVRVELLEGIVAANGRPFDSWGFAFSTGD